MCDCDELMFMMCLKDKADYLKDYPINCITMSKVLCLAVTAVMYTNPQVTPSDVFG